LLADFAKVDHDRLRVAFLSRFDMDAKTLMSFDIGGGKTVGDLVAAVRADDNAPEAAVTAQAAFKPRAQHPRHGG
jgi:hypothetical protein